MTVSNADLLFVYESDCLKVRVISRHILLQKEPAILAIAAAMAAQPIKGVFVDLREIPGPITFNDRYHLGELAGQHLRGQPIAVLVFEEQADPERIGKVAARNRGANVEVFTDLAEAQA